MILIFHPCVRLITFACAKAATYNFPTHLASPTKKKYTVIFDAMCKALDSNYNCSYQMNNGNVPGVEKCVIKSFSVAMPKTRTE